MYQERSFLYSNTCLTNLNIPKMPIVWNPNDSNPYKLGNVNGDRFIYEGTSFDTDKILEALENEGFYYQIDLSQINKNMDDGNPYNRAARQVLRLPMTYTISTENDWFTMNPLNKVGNKWIEKTAERPLDIPIPTRLESENTSSNNTDKQNVLNKIKNSVIKNYLEQLDSKYDELFKKLSTKADPIIGTFEKIIQENTNIKDNYTIEPSQFDRLKFVQSILSKIENSNTRTMEESVSSNIQTININKELKWLEKVLPSINKESRVKLLNKMISIGQSTNPKKTFGLFKNGITYICKYSPMGTLYHEIFHDITLSFMNTKEYNTMMEAASKKYPNIHGIALEEKLAEDFRKYTIAETYGVGSSLIKFFRKLKHLVFSLFNKEVYLDNLFYRINRGEFANKIRLKNTLSRYSEEQYTPEMQAIKDKAIANGTFMKAPNGNPTNLTERQWLHVRSKAFKNWFGDWENDAENASKVVDENGEPLVVYSY